MRSLLIDLHRHLGAEFALKGKDTIAYSFPAETSPELLRAALTRVKAVQPGAVAVLRHVASLP